MNTTNTVLTTKQLHQRWGYHIESIRRMIRDGRLPAMRFGKRLRVALVDVEEFERDARIDNLSRQK